MVEVGIMKSAGWMILFIGIAGLTGCTTYLGEDTAEVSDAERERLALQQMKVDVARLLDRVEAVEQTQQDLYAQVETLKTAKERGNQDVLDQLAATLKANDAAMARLKQEIIESVAKKVSEIMNSRPAAAAQQGRGEIVGREHVVQPGETLSAIAAAYKVKSGAIMQANGLKNANSIRAGQKLFIPE